ncbi:MAG: RNA methyltransferase [Gemmatimonadaceae bacterium]|nr:RNA methyltransferase [Gemmatimonadaceae bacterium]
MRRKARERQGMFVAEGVRTVEELLASPLPVRGVLTCDLIDRTPRGAALVAQCHARDVEVVRVSEREFVSASDTDNPQGILAIAEIPTRSLEALTRQPPARLLVLDGIQDPGNVGTLLRTASALGCGATLVLPGTVDPWNAKVVRSAVGMQFTHSTISCTEEQFQQFLGDAGVVAWGADASGVILGAEPALPRLAIVVGNEGAGLKPSVRDLCAGLVAIPMAVGAESLNVAVAAGILLHALRPSSAS